jgi:type IV secretion system protein VirD4
MDDHDVVLNAVLPRGVPARPNKLTGAEWASAGDLGLKWDYNRTKLLLGYRGLNVKGELRMIGLEDDRHMLTVAGSRAGKGVSLMIPNLLLYKGSVLAIDPKGELAAVTKRAREQMGQRCFVLDPFGANGDYPSACFNPLAELDIKSPTLIDDVALVADALIIPSERDPHFTDNARRLLKALMIYVLMKDDPASANLTVMRDYLMLEGLDRADALAGESPEETLLNNMLLTATTGDVLNEEAQVLLRKEAQAFLALRKESNREFASIVSTARTQTEFLDSPSLRKILKNSDFRLRDLKRERMTIYLCLPPSRMASHATWLRVMIGLSLVVLGEKKKQDDIPVLLLLEEFPALGYMRSIEAAAGQIAGFGVKLWTVLQDLGQIKKLYKESWETFVGNAGVLTFFGNSDMTTLKYISEKLGHIGMNLERASGASATQLSGGANPIQEELRESPLLHPHEVEQIFDRERNLALVMAAGKLPVVLQRANYRSDPLFEGFFDEWPYRQNRIDR